MSALLVSAISICFSLIIQATNALSANYYHNTCPNAESIITKAVRTAMHNDKTVPAALLRMHFHDCFIRGCDASVLLDSKGKNKTEKDGAPNKSLHAFYVIDNAKKKLEKMCPGVVSCADILAVAARDAVALSGGPSWDVPKGRKDGRVSKANESLQLPFPTSNISQLHKSFFKRGLSSEDLVALSGGHTLGFAHCSSFQNRIHKFSKARDVDPSMNRSFAARLRRACPKSNKKKKAGATLDFSPTIFDNAYYKMMLKGKSIFSSDQALLANARTKTLVTKFARSEKDFFDAFAKAMVKMSSINGNGGRAEIRFNCRAPN